jgi:predicted ester cyclase
MFMDSQRLRFPARGYPCGDAPCRTTGDSGGRMRIGLRLERWGKVSAPEEMRELVGRLEVAMNERRLNDLDEIVSDDFVRHCEATPDVQVRSRADFKQFLEGFAAAFPDNVQTFTHVVAEGDEIGVLATYEGTHQGAFGPLQPTGKRVNFTFAGVMKVTSGKISEFWVTWDNIPSLVNSVRSVPSQRARCDDRRRATPKPTALEYSRSRMISDLRRLARRDKHAVPKDEPRPRTPAL